MVAPLPETGPILAIRCLTHRDLAFADSLRALVGWNQTVEDWQTFLSLSSRGCFLAEWAGQPAGTAITLVYGDTLGWIGMLLVHPDYRGRGIGKALLLRCLDHLKQRGVSCLQLDATPQGRLLYGGLGFTDQWPLSRWQNLDLPHPRPTGQTGIRLWTKEDLPAVGALDQHTFGTSRHDLIQKLFERPKCALVHEIDGRVEGFGLIRNGSRAQYLGPVVACSPHSGMLLVRHLLMAAVGQPVYWDIPDSNSVAVGLAKSLGFTPQRPLLRMALGSPAPPSQADQYFAIVDPAAG